jgi:hypothetical protein
VLEHLRGEVLGIAAQYAQFAGWLNAHAMRPTAAHTWHDRALGWAAESGDADMTATTLNLKSHAAWLGGKAGPMIGLSQAAQSGTSISAEVRGLAVQLEARGHALAGDEDNAHRKLDEAASLMENAAGDPEGGPPWTYSYSPAYLALQRGLAHFYLDQNTRAAEWLSAGLTEMPPQTGQSEWITWWGSGPASTVHGRHDWSVHIASAAGCRGTAWPPRKMRSAGCRTQTSREAAASSPLPECPDRHAASAGIPKLHSVAPAYHCLDSAFQDLQRGGAFRTCLGTPNAVAAQAQPGHSPACGATDVQVTGHEPPEHARVQFGTTSNCTITNMDPVSGVLGEAWKLYRGYAAHFLAIAFMIYFVAAILEAILAAFAGTIGAGIALIISLVAVFILEGALVKAVQDIRDGRVDLDLRVTVSAAVPYLLPLGAASVLASAGIAIGFALIIVPGLVLLTFWSLIVPFMVIGGAGVFASFSRSWRTVRGYGWPVFRTYVAVFLILIAFHLVLWLILSALPAAVREFITSIVAGTLLAPFLALVVTLLYYRLTAGHGSRQPQEPGDAGIVPPVVTG